MQALNPFIQFGLIAAAAYFALALLAIAAGTGLQAYASRRIARAAFNLQLQGSLWGKYMLVGVPAFMLISLLWGVGMPSLALVALCLGAAPVLRYGVKPQALAAQEQDPAALKPLDWGRACAVSAGSMLVVLLAFSCLMFVIRLFGLAAVLGWLASP